MAIYKLTLLMFKFPQDKPSPCCDKHNELIQDAHDIAHSAGKSPPLKANPLPNIFFIYFLQSQIYSN